MNDLEFLSFHDYVEMKEHENNEWVIVTRHDDYDYSESRRGSWSTLCVLVPNKPEMIKELAKKFEWEIGWEFLESHEGRHYEENQLHPDVVLKDGIQFEPLILKTPIVPLLSQDFINHFGLTHDVSQKKYFHGTTVVAEYVDSQHLRVKASYLKDYLKDRKMVLVRYHQHTREIAKPISEIVDEKEIMSNVIDEKRKYRITVCSNRLNRNETISMLLGKDLFLPE